MSENYDATWLDYMPTVNYGQSYVYTTSSPVSFRPYYEQVEKLSYTEPAVPVANPAKPKRKTKASSDKENSEVAGGYTFSQDERDEIDDSVREAIVGPRRVAEVATRKAAVEALGVEDKHAVGTVLTFKRKIGKVEYLFVALKADEDKWHGVGGGSSSFTKDWEGLLTWMTTGENLVSDVQVATSFEPITWEITSISPVTV